MTRDEHLAWAKRRALQYLDRGDVVNALTSMMSDLNKHEELRGIADKLGMLYLFELQRRTAKAPADLSRDSAD